MKRNAVRAGMIDQRSRASTRRRDRSARQPIADDNANEVLCDWIKTKFNEYAIEQIERIDLKEFLRDVAHLEIPSAEGLRQLAIHSESECMAYRKRGLLALKRIYDFAVDLDPENVAVLHSMSISAREIAEIEDDDKTAEEIWGVAVSAIRRAIELAPNDADVHTQCGMIHYVRGEIEEALLSFGEALKHDPKNGWAQLYTAHCLHDQEKWSQALAAYQSVDLSRFTGAGSWRVDVLREQSAHCRLMTGDRGGALSDFQHILDRYEREPHLAYWAMSASLWSAANGELNQEIGQRAIDIDRMATEAQRV